ncbi:MAG: hypothetical protein KA186_11375 [Flavobacteriales bacterium]|nr:hypothetical protein [Flavobacteriales bacterium]
MRFPSASLPFVLFVSLLGLARVGHAQCTANAGADQAVCGGVSLNLVGVGGGGTAPYSYSWSPATYLSSTNTAATTFNYPVPVNSTQVVNLTLTVTDASGCTTTDVVAVTVNVTPNAQINSTGPEEISTFNGLTTFRICDPSASWPFSFTDLSPAAPAATRTLDWGDGSAVINPAAGWAMTHTYNQGLYTITYTVAIAGGCTNTEQFQVFLGTNPGGGISTDPNTTICTGGSLPFYISPQAFLNSPGTTYLIDFGDGIDTLLNHPPPASITHTYNVSSCTDADGEYTVYFTAQNPCDHTDGQISPVRVSESPSAQFIISPNDTACLNSTVTFTDQSTGRQAPSCALPKRIWSIVPAVGWTTAGALGNTNGNPANPTLWTTGAAALAVQFTSPGTYTITDLTGNSCGVSSLSRSVCIEAPPQPAFTVSPDDDCAPFTSIVNNTSISPNSCLTTYEWDVTTSGGSCGSGPVWAFADGTNANSITPHFLISQAGTYTVHLEARNSCGPVNVTRVINANAAPTVDVAALTGICATQCVDPSAVVQDCGATINTYLWSFPSGTPNSASTLDPGQICFASATNSSIALTVTNQCGSASDATNLAVGNIPGIPVISSNSPVCAGNTLSLTAEAIAGASFSWTGPNGFASNMPAVTIPGASAVNAGTYTVVAMFNGCAGPPATVNVQVVAAPAISVTPSSPSVCPDSVVSFTASGAGNYQWYQGSTLVGAGPTFSTVASATTSYTVTGDVGGCSGTANVPITVFTVAPITTGGDQLFCDQAIGEPLPFSPSGGTWTGPNISQAGVFTPVPGQLGSVIVTYTRTDGNGCIATDDATITVQAVSQFANAGNDTILCQSNFPGDPTRFASRRYLGRSGSRRIFRSKFRGYHRRYLQFRDWIVCYE